LRQLLQLHIRQPEAPAEAHPRRDLRRVD
jgi:hypothetical protein